MRAVRSVGVGTLAAWLWMLVALPASARHDEGPRRPEAREAAGGRAALAEAPALPIAPPAPWPVMSPEIAADLLPGDAVSWSSLSAPPSLGALMQGGGGSGGPTFEYYALDALGSVRVVFDAAGAVKARADYEPFGSPITASTTGPLPREQFTGQQRDSEVGLDYFGARFYHATHGRMLSVDPLYAGALVEPQRWNRYAYALNSPIVYSDPDGRVACTGTGQGQGFVGGCEPQPMINTPTPGQAPLLGNFGVGSTDPYDYFDVQYGPGYRPDPMGGVRVGPPPPPAAVIIAGQISIDDEGNVVFVPDPKPDTSIPFVPPVAAMGGQVGRALGAVIARIFGSRGVTAAALAAAGRYPRQLEQTLRMTPQQVQKSVASFTGTIDAHSTHRDQSVHAIVITPSRHRDHRRHAPV